MIFKNISKTKLSLALISLAITFFVWQQGLRDSLSRPSVSFDISQKEQEITDKVNTKTDKLIIDFLNVYENFVRAKDVYVNKEISVEGLDIIIKNMESILSEYEVKPIDAVGKIFDPNLHEAVSTVNDQSLDDNTITKEIAKGYISQNRVIKPSKVIVSKKSQVNE